MYKFLCKPIQVRIRFVPTKLLLTVFVSSLNKLILTKQCSQNWENEGFANLLFWTRLFNDTIYS